MKNLAKMVFFSLAIVAFFAGFSNFGLPQIKPSPPPRQEKIDLKSMTLDKYIAIGEGIYNKICMLCHNPVGRRAPMLKNVARVYRQRLNDPRYHGKATDLESYLFESTRAPSAYVVAGYGKAGSNDTESPMPVITGPSVGLSEVQLGAVVAFVENLGGAEVTVHLPSTDGKAIAPAPGVAKPVAAAKPAIVAAAGAPRAALPTPQAIIAHFGCGLCHTLPGQHGVVGPNLTAIGNKRSPNYLRRAILTPNADIAEGFRGGIMPQDFGQRMYARELETMVVYLSGLKGDQS